MNTRNRTSGEVGREIIGLDIDELVQKLKTAFADEWLAYYQYWIGAKVIVGKMRPSVEKELEEHAKDEERHAGMIADRMIQLGYDPQISPDELTSLGECGFTMPDPKLVPDVLQQNIDGERCAIRFYKELLDFVRGKDDVTFEMVREILEDEVEHEEDLEMMLADMSPDIKMARELLRISKSLVGVS